MSARRIVFSATLLLTLIVLSGCGPLGSPQNTLAPDGDVANLERNLFILVIIPAIPIFFLVFGALVYIMIRYRHREGDSLPKQIHGNTRLEVAWTILPLMLLLGLTVPVIKGILDVGQQPKASDLHVTVVASQWQWTFKYTDPEFALPDGSPMTSKELHIPVDQYVGVTLQSQDVIHSFWVPKLAGKLDVVPGRNNKLRFNATKVGTYSGQCAEFCGIGHAGMRMTTIAETQGDFQTWAQQQMSAQSK